MDMAVDMVLTKAVISGAFGAITKLKVRIIRIRSAADSTFVPIQIGGLLSADLSGFTPEVDRASAYRMYAKE